MFVKGIRALTYSEIRTWKQCRYRHELSYVKRYAANERASYFKRGSVVHRFIELMHTKKEEVKIDDLISQLRMEWIEEVRVGLLQELQARTDGDNETSKEEDVVVVLSDDDKTELAVLEGMIRAYHKYYFLNNEFTGYLAEVEVTASIDDSVSWVKIDGIVKLNGAYWIHEIKTASSFSENDRLLLNIDDQSHHYLMTVKAKWPEKNFTGAIRTILKTPSIKQTKKETVDEYCERVIADYQERPDFYLRRFYVEKPQQMIDEYRDYFKTIYKEIVLSTFAPKTPGTQTCCMCDFFGYCTEVDTSVKEEILKRDFYVRGSNHSNTSNFNNPIVQHNKQVA